MFGAEFWVGAAFFIFMGILAYLGVHKTILAGLDARGNKIAEQLNEAERLRKEAAELLSSFEAKRLAAEKEAEEIVTAAKSEAKRLEKEAKLRLDEFVKRRTAQAEMKISHAEIQAMQDVRNAAAELATKAAASLLSAGAGDDLFNAGLTEVKSQLN